MITKKQSNRPFVVRDTREKAGKGWTFGGPHSAFEDTISKTLKTGDYSISTMEKIVCIERKGVSTEFFGNLFCDWERFRKELDRMRKFPVAAIILEFEFEEVINWKDNKALPLSLRDKIDKWAYLAKISQLRIDYPNIHIIFAGKYGREAAGSLLKRVYEEYGN